MKKNVFVIGPVASGKNTLLENLKEIYNLSILDTGQLYRYLTAITVEKTDINPDLEILKKLIKKI